LNWQAGLTPFERSAELLSSRQTEIVPSIVLSRTNRIDFAGPADKSEFTGFNINSDCIHISEPVNRHCFRQSSTSPQCSRPSVRAWFG